MQTPALFQRFVDDELALAPTLVSRVLAGTAQLLGPSPGSVASIGERSYHADLVAALQRDAALYQRTFVESLAKLVAQERGADTAERQGDGRSVLGSLELMDESRVEIDIEISRAMQLIDTTAEWELRELQTFTSTLLGDTHVTAESNPFRPLVYATALWEAASAVVGAQVQRAIILRTSAGVAAGLLKTGWAAATTRLESQGVEPGTYRTVVLPSGATFGRAATEVPRPGGLSTLLASMPQPRAAAGVSAPVGQPEPEPIAVERQVNELVARLFDAMLADSQVPDPFRPVLSRLQRPVLRATLAEPAVLDAHDHPLWQLIDRIGEVAAGYSRVDDARLASFLVSSGDVAEELAGASSPDAALFRRGLNRIEVFLSEQLQAQLRAAQPAVDALKVGERREVLRQHLAQRLTDQMVPVRTAPAIRRFVTGTWAQVIAEHMLRDGEQSDPTMSVLKTVDDLLWSLKIPDHPQSRQRLLSLLPGLLQRIRAGMELVALPAAERQTVLNELMTIHTEALRPGARGGASGALTPEEIVQRMRDEVLPDGATGGSFSDSVIDLSSMETVPAEHLPTGGDRSDDDPARRVESLRVGQRQRIFLQGHWSRVQLLWRSDRGLFFLFAGESPTRTHSITRRALERLAAAGLVQPLEAKPLVPRAADRMMRAIAPRG